MKDLPKLVHQVLQQAQRTHEAAEHPSQENQGKEQRSQETEDITPIPGEQDGQMGQIVAA